MMRDAIFSALLPLPCSKAAWFLASFVVINLMGLLRLEMVIDLCDEARYCRRELSVRPSVRPCIVGWVADWETNCSLHSLEPQQFCVNIPRLWVKYITGVIQYLHVTSLLVTNVTYDLRITDVSHPGRFAPCLDEEIDGRTENAECRGETSLDKTDVTEKYGCISTEKLITITRWVAAEPLAFTACLSRH